LSRPVRMSDVAKLAGVGTMTVSRVLNGNVFVTEETTARVLKAVAKLKYQPNEIARSLREQRTRQIGIIIPNLHNQFFASCAHAINLVAQQHSYSTIITTSDGHPTTESVEAKRMLRRYIEGLIIVPAIGKSQLLDPEFTGTPIVTIDSPIPRSPFDSVVVQNKYGSQLGVQHLIKHRHRRIVFLGVAPEKWSTKQRSDGYRAAMEAAGLKTETRIISESMSELYEVIRSLSTRKLPPTALFCSNNLITRETLHVISKLDLRIPQDLALVGFDDFEMADMMTPAITAIRQPVDVMGRVAAELLFSRLTNSKEREKPKRIMLPVELIVRDSCGSNRA
jgi:LacI family transcriptional regulator